MALDAEDQQRLSAEGSAHRRARIQAMSPLERMELAFRLFQMATDAEASRSIEGEGS